MPISIDQAAAWFAADRMLAQSSDSGLRAGPTCLQGQEVGSTKVPRLWPDIVNGNHTEARARMRAAFATRLRARPIAGLPQPWPPREAPLLRASPGSLTDQLDPQIEAENVRGRGERVEADVVVIGVENPVQLAPARAHRSSHGTLAHLPSFHGLLQLPSQNALDRIGSGLLEGSLLGPNLRQSDHHPVNDSLRAYHSIERTAMTVGAAASGISSR